MTNLRTVAKRRSGSISQRLPAMYAKTMETKAVIAEKMPSLTTGA